jgi:hypothetical protein
MGMRMALETWFDTHGIRRKLEEGNGSIGWFIGPLNDGLIQRAARIMHEDSFSKKAIALTLELGGVPSTNSGGWSVNRHRFFLRERRPYRFQRPLRR